MTAFLLSLALLQGTNGAVVPTPINNQWWMNRHQAMNNRAKQGDVDLVFIGDSITHAFAGEPDTGDDFANRGKDTWDLFYGDRKAINLGISGDRTQHVLWRLENGNLAGLKPKVAVIMIGTNNCRANSAEQIAAGVEAVCLKVREKCPATKILLLAIFPRDDFRSDNREKVNATNALLKQWAPRNHVSFLDIGSVFLDAKGEIPREIMPDKLHPFAFGYRLWGMALEPTLAKLLGRRPKSTADPHNWALVPVTHNRDPYNWMGRHLDVLRLVRTKNPQLIFIGDSITHRWGGEPLTEGLDHGQAAWDKHFAQWNPANLGFGWDRTENVLWRLEQGELTMAKPKVVAILIGTNNLARNTTEEVRDGIEAVVRRVRLECPMAKVLLLALLPRGQKSEDPLRQKAVAVNALLPAVARRQGATFYDAGAGFLNSDGSIKSELMGDALHPGAEGYEVLGAGLEPEIAKLMKAR